MDVLDAANAVRAIMMRRFSARCDDRRSARAWYARNIDIWDEAKIATHAPDNVKSARAGIVLEGAPDREQGPDCWGVKISSDPAVLDAIPGWYLECWARWLVLFYPTPTVEQIEDFRAQRIRSRPPQ
jgi:hypothetical protein